MGSRENPAIPDGVAAAGWIIHPWAVLRLAVSKVVACLLPLLPAFAMLFAYQWERSKRHHTIETRVLSAVMAVEHGGHSFGRSSRREALPTADTHKRDASCWCLSLPSRVGSACTDWPERPGLNQRQLAAVSVMMLASMLLLYCQADTMMIRSDSSMRPNGGSHLEGAGVQRRVRCLRFQRQTLQPGVLFFSGF